MPAELGEGRRGTGGRRGSYWHRRQLLGWSGSTPRASATPADSGDQLVGYGLNGTAMVLGEDQRDEGSSVVWRNLEGECSLYRVEGVAGRSGRRSIGMAFWAAKGQGRGLR